MTHRLQKERIYFRAPDNLIAMVVSIRGLDSTQKLQCAILRMAAHHATLSCRVMLREDGALELEQQPNGYTYRLTSFEANSPDEWRRVYLEQLRIPFAIDEGELMRFFELRNTETGERQLLMLAHHLVVDGAGMIYILRDIMKCLSCTESWTETLPVRLYDMSDVPKQARLPFLMRTGLKSCASKWNAHGYVFDDGEYARMCRDYWSKTDIEITQRTLEPELTRKLVSECHARGVTVNSALTAAFMQATNAMPACNCGLAVSLRPNGYEGMGVFATGITVKYACTPAKGYWQNVRDLHALIKQQLDMPSKKYFLVNFMASLPPTLIDAAYFAAFTDYDDTTAHSIGAMFGYIKGDNGKTSADGINVTNLTRAPILSEYGAYSISGLKFAPPLMPNSRRMLSVVTLDDELSVVLQSRAGENDVSGDAFLDNALALVRCAVDK